MADFLFEFRKAKKIGNTSRLIEQLVWIESLTILDLRYAKNRTKKDLLEEKYNFSQKCRKWPFFAKQQTEDQGKIFKNGRFFGRISEG